MGVLLFIMLSGGRLPLGPSGLSASHPSAPGSESFLDDLQAWLAAHLKLQMADESCTWTQVTTLYSSGAKSLFLGGDGRLRTSVK